jgi:hypothetical protein
MNGRRSLAGTAHVTRIPSARRNELSARDVPVPPHAKAAGAIDPTGRRKAALDAYLIGKLHEGFEIETHTETHAIIVGRDERTLLRRWLRRQSRFVISVDEHGAITSTAAEPKRT